MVTREFYPGERVAYRTHEFATIECGTVARWNNDGTLVFVLFDGSPQPKSCRPEDLRLLAHEEESW